MLKKRDSAGNIEVTHETVEELKKKKELNLLEMECMSGQYGLLLFDDLKMATVASAKLLTNKGDPEEIEKLRKGIMPKREVRKVIFSDSETDLSQIEENFNERDVRIEAGEMKPRRGKNKS